MARPKKPLLLQKLNGAFENHPERLRERENELQLAGSVGLAPEWMSSEGREEWEARISDPVYSKVLASGHRSLMIEYCLLHGRMIRAARGLKEWADGKEGRKKEAFPSRDGSRLHALRMQLGLTPASQSKVQMPKQEAPGNKWARVG